LLVSGALASPAAAAPLAYVIRGSDPPTEVTTLDVATGSATGSIPIDTRALRVAVTPDGTRAYVPGSTDVKVIDTATNTVVGAIPIAGSVGLTVAPDGKHVYVAKQDTDQLFVVDTATNLAAGMPIPTGDRPRAVVVNAAGTRAYVGNTGTPYSVTVVDLVSNTIVTTIPAGGFLDRPENLTITPDGSHVYAANFGATAGGTSVSVIDTATNTITGNITVGRTPITVAADPSGARVYVAARGDSRLDIIDVASGASEEPVELPFAPVGIAIAPHGDRLVVSGGNKVGVLDLATREFIAPPITVPEAAGVAILPVQSPVASIGAAGTQAGQPSTFDGSGSTAALGRVTGYDWLFGDGASASGPSVTHTYAAPGTYDVALTVTNDCAANAVFGPLGVAGGGSTPFCNGPRSTSSKTQISVAAPPADVDTSGASHPPTRGGSVVRTRRTPSVRWLRNGALRVDTGIDVICGAVPTGCGGSQRSTARTARSHRLLLAATKLPALTRHTLKVAFTVSPRTARRLARDRWVRVATGVVTRNAEGKSVTTRRTYSLAIPRRR
jgi:YVTN family beta-propeller protein